MTQHKPGLALDIDETLSWTVGHWVKEMLDCFGNPENLSLHDLIAKYRYTQNVPYWQTKEAEEWMEKMRGSNNFQTEFEPMPSAIQSVKELNNIVPVIKHLTVRPETVLNGTKTWLKKHGFPEAEVIARPTDVPHAKGNEWKAIKLVELYPNVQGIVDDNAGLLQYLPKSYKGHIFLYTHTTIPDNPLENVYACPDWKSVVQQVEKVFSNIAK